MKESYNMANAKKGSVISPKHKIRVTMYLDDNVIKQFRKRAEEVGLGYQTLINSALKEYLSKNKIVTLNTVRLIIREELKHAHYT